MSTDIRVLADAATSGLTLHRAAVAARGDPAQLVAAERPFSVPAKSRAGFRI